MDMVPVTGRSDCAYHIHFLVVVVGVFFFLLSFVIVHVGFEFNLFFQGLIKLFHRIVIEIVIVVVINNRVVPCMGVGSRLSLALLGISNFFLVILVTIINYFYFISFIMSSC